VEVDTQVFMIIRGCWHYWLCCYRFRKQDVNLSGYLQLYGAWQYGRASYICCSCIRHFLPTSSFLGSYKRTSRLVFIDCGYLQELQAMKTKSAEEPALVQTIQIVSCKDQ